METFEYDIKDGYLAISNEVTDIPLLTTNQTGIYEYFLKYNTMPLVGIFAATTKNKQALAVVNNNCIFIWNENTVETLVPIAVKTPELDGLTVYGLFGIENYFVALTPVKTVIYDTNGTLIEIGPNVSYYALAAKGTTMNDIVKMMVDKHLANVCTIIQKELSEKILQEYQNAKQPHYEQSVIDQFNIRLSQLQEDLEKKLLDSVSPKAITENTVYYVRSGDKVRQFTVGDNNMSCPANGEPLNKKENPTMASDSQVEIGDLPTSVFRHNHKYVQLKKDLNGVYGVVNNYTLLQNGVDYDINSVEFKTMFQMLNSTKDFFGVDLDLSELDVWCAEIPMDSLGAAIRFASLVYPRNKRPNRKRLFCINRLFDGNVIQKPLFIDIGGDTVYTDAFVNFMKAINDYGYLIPNYAFSTNREKVMKGSIPIGTAFKIDTILDDGLMTMQYIK